MDTGSTLPQYSALLGGFVGDLIARLLYTDIKTYLIELCMKQDNMSMAASIESRVPFLDHPLVEFAAGIPSQYKIRGLTGKRILKSAVRGMLPESIIHRRKMGFPTPFRGWLADRQLNFVEHMLLDPRSLLRGIFQPDAVRRYLAEHRSGQADHSDRIWRLLNLELWQHVFIDHDSHVHLESATGRVAQRSLEESRFRPLAGNNVV